MHIVDLLIFVVYMLVMLGIGFYFHRKNKDVEDYYVGGRGNTLTLTLLNINLPLDLAPNLFGLTCSFLSYIFVYKWNNRKKLLAPEK